MTQKTKLPGLQTSAEVAGTIMDDAQVQELALGTPTATPNPKSAPAHQRQKGQLWLHKLTPCSVLLIKIFWMLVRKKKKKKGTGPILGHVDTFNRNAN